ncbi:MAG: alanine racemase [Gilliamella sp.]|uniref:alanine racemase n=1 Tax=unclassified Gilliamella TaxID=2685620 RepID=UPI00080DAA09|nr:MULTISPECIES: alanine racemase [Gilliamella]MCO6537951.1 alanine racemase [Gilliamella sp.]MCO6539630.1 alanine racemase [Gilliamella sp.]MCO6549923.1 alanine racemase [Gilliamella sp.]MCO6554125.1 alanine racemase [Gilliamella sp.]OCG33870.1 alanine racemase [Gilliamella apicola]
MSIAVVEVNRQAVIHNVEYLKKMAPNSQLVAIIKANAYSHGSEEIAQLLHDKVNYFGVSRLTEAMQLRNNGINTPILALEGFFPHDDLDYFIDFNIQPAIHSKWQIDILQTSLRKDQITTWFKLDTGMHRLGFCPDEAKDEFYRLASCSVVCKPINIMSHFSSADDLSSEKTLKQIELFDEFINSIDDKSLIGKRSIAASGGILAWPKAQRDVVRQGIALYGVSPFDESIAELQPAMTFKSELIAVRKHKKGESVGYGQIWCSQQDTKLGVVAMGYGDGYPRNIPENTPVLINGRKVPIVGRVSMDMIVVDLGINCLEKPGDEVIFWGAGLPVEEIAKHTGISAYELITRLTSRAKIHYIDKLNYD